VSEQGLTSSSTHYRSFQRWVLLSGPTQGDHVTQWYSLYDCISYIGTHISRKEKVVETSDLWTLFSLTRVTYVIYALFWAEVKDHGHMGQLKFWTAADSAVTTDIWELHQTCWQQVFPSVTVGFSQCSSAARLLFGNSTANVLIMLMYCFPAKPRHSVFQIEILKVHI